ncbi:hypothetical protein JCM15908A_04410 [Prevotella dentasini JCM 15908]
MQGQDRTAAVVGEVCLHTGTGQTAPLPDFRKSSPRQAKSSTPLERTRATAGKASPVNRHTEAEVPFSEKKIKIFLDSQDYLNYTI